MLDFIYEYAMKGSGVFGDFWQSHFLLILNFVQIGTEFYPPELQL
jgi:hypothetical protein